MFASEVVSDRTAEFGAAGGQTFKGLLAASVRGAGQGDDVVREGPGSCRKIVPIPCGSEGDERDRAGRGNSLVRSNVKLY